MADPQLRAGARYADEKLPAWTAQVHAPHDEALERAFTSPGREGMPPISVGPNEGRTLQLLLRLAGVRRVVEIGTLATIWMARAPPADGHLWTLERDLRHAEVARRNLS
ncbi:MAG: hypothetical protein R3B99_12410 [Polyangiales bacterium]